MAAGALPAPGSPSGPCDEECTHRDCAHTRLMGAATCRICGEAIGYETRFYDEATPEQRRAGEQRLVHALCLEKEVGV